MCRNLKKKKHRYFLTYQSKGVVNILNNGDFTVSQKYYKNTYDPIKAEVNYNPIFFIPLNNKVDFFIKNFFTTPSTSECIIITELDEYDCIDMAEWFEIKITEPKRKSLRVGENCGLEVEYIANKIFKDKVKEKISINDVMDSSTNLDYVKKYGTKMITCNIKFWKFIDQYLDQTDKKLDMTTLVISDDMAEINREIRNMMDNGTSKQKVIETYRNLVTNLSKDSKFKKKKNSSKFSIRKVIHKIKFW